MVTMGKWNDTDSPIAYLITFRTYGTWLPVDGRGSIDKYHNKFRGPRAVVSSMRQAEHEARLKSPPFLLNANSRNLVEFAIREVCAFRAWSMFAINVRTNHTHVVSAGGESARMLNAFKAYSTRRLRDSGEWQYKHSPWVDKGSTRNLWTEMHIDAACDYVVNGQGGPLPDFD